MIRYLENATDITTEQLHGFFVGWRNTRSPEEHLALLRGSDHVVLAVDDSSGRVVGFITALFVGILRMRADENEECEMTHKQRLEILLRAGYFAAFWIVVPYLEHIVRQGC